MPKKNTKVKTEKLKKKSKEEKAKKDDKEIERILKAGLHFGHKRSKGHPKMGPFIYGMRNHILIIDPLKTKVALNQALEYLKQKKKEGALVLFIGTKISAKKLIKSLAEELKMPYVIERWLGGTLTNFEIVNKRIQYLREMEEKIKKGEFDKYTKKEKMRIDQEIERIKRKIGGLLFLKKLPDLLFVVDVHKEKLAVKEAKAKGIPVVGICDTDGDPTSVDYPIPANDDGLSSLKYILGKVKKVLS